MAARRFEDRGSSSLEFVWVRLNGSDTTIEGALRTIQGIRNSGTPARQLNNQTSRQLPAKNGNPDDAPQDAPLFDSERGSADADIVPQDPSDSNVATRAPRKTRLPKGIPDLDFNSASPSFREFVAEKKPQDQFDFYLLVAAWLKAHKQIEEIGLDHIVTAKQYIGSAWGCLPDDAGQPFRDGRRAAHGIFAKGSKNGLSKITKTGEDRVSRMGKPQ